MHACFLNITLKGYNEKLFGVVYIVRDKKYFYYRKFETSSIKDNGKKNMEYSSSSFSDYQGTVKRISSTVPSFFSHMKANTRYYIFKAEKIS